MKKMYKINSDYYVMYVITYLLLNYLCIDDDKIHKSLSILNELISTKIHYDENFCEMDIVKENFYLEYILQKPKLKK